MIPFRGREEKEVTCREMNMLYSLLKTPYKYGPVLKIPGFLTDSPSVFYHEGRWYMYYIAIGEVCGVSGYESHIAVSDNLVDFTPIKTIFHRDDEGRWDSRQVASYAALFDTELGGSNTNSKCGDYYYLSYLGGGSDGYEPDPLYMGLARGRSPIGEFCRKDEPILRPCDNDIRVGEERTLYRSYIFEDKEGLTGYRYVNVYNAKNNDDRERIYLAVSDDCEVWERYGDRAIIDDLADCPTNRISGDAEIIRVGDIYVLLYFRIIDGEGGYDTFAASRDLVHWKKWDGEPLIAPGDSFDNLHAHKPWLVKVGDVIYHYYCACNTDGERFIALATSRPINHTTHEMKLADKPFSAIRDGEKTVEMRLFDEKRKLIKVGDRIEFTNLTSGEVLLVRVKNLRTFRDFGELYAAYPKDAIGYADDEIADPADMEAYYSKEKIAEYGTLAIEIERVSDEQVYENGDK